MIELLIVLAIVAILSAIAIPFMRTQILLARETAAARHIGTINQAEAQFYAQFGVYSNKLDELGPPPLGKAALIPENLAGGAIGGYRFSVQGSENAYAVHANPEDFGRSGRKSFFSDQTLVIRQNWGQQPANETSEIFK